MSVNVKRLFNITAMSVLLLAGAACTKTDEVKQDSGKAVADVKATDKPVAPKPVQNAASHPAAVANAKVGNDPIRRINFVKGADHAIITGNLSGFEDVQYFVVDAAKGQTMTVEQLDQQGAGLVSVYVTAPNGANANDMDLSCHSNATISPTIDGDYGIKVVECKKADPWKGVYGIKVTIK